jgi:cystathionine gamma-lyase
MAAITALMSVALLASSSPKVLVMPSDGYYGARKLAGGFFAPLGVEVRYAPTEGNAQLNSLAGANLLWLESPSNPSLEVCDLSKLIVAAHGHGALVAVDNTTATVLGQSPLDLGADFSVSSDSKVITGHGDLVLGHVTARDPAWADRLRAFRTEQGAIPGPMEAWLAHRSLATLDVRFERQCGNALEIARFLSERPEVALVRYPGLPSDPAFPTASRQMRRFGPVVSFVLDGKEKADDFLERCSLVLSTTSFGGVHTTAERRARWGGDAIPDGFIRMSAGCEDIRDILHDLDQALGGKPRP